MDSSASGPRSTDIDSLCDGIDVSKISPEILQEIEIFEGEVQRFKAEEISADQFRGFRLQHGVYGQRQAGVQMFRIKIPQGRLKVHQFRRIIELCDEYASGVLHLSTRQNIQMHFVKLEDTSRMMLRLAEVGITTREACGDTVRNVTACPLAGVCPNEVLDVTPYGLAITQNFLRNPICQRLPRKFKIALEGCPDSELAATAVHDIGITAQKRGNQIGFRITVGGGLGATPRVGKVLLEFAPPEDLIAICEALIRVFDRHGQRQNRYKARMKFLIEKLGFEKFSSLWKNEFNLITSQNGHYRLPQVPEEPHRFPATPKTWSREEATGPLANWLMYNVMRQKQAGFNVVSIKIPLGDLTTAQARSVADLCDTYSDGTLRVTIQQNFQLRWVHEADLPTLFEHLSEIGLAEAGADRIENIVSCPGTDSCGLSLTSSKGLTRALSSLFEPGNPQHDDLNGMSMKISGCQNACAQHQLAAIGFHGLGKKVKGHTAPFYEIYLGGTNSKLAMQVVKIPAKRVPDAVRHLIDWYRSERTEGESFQDFSTRMGRPNLKDSLMPFTFLPAFEEDQSFYIDWGDEKEFSTEDLGPGECAGGAYELMEGFMFESDQELHLAKVMSEKGQTGHAINKAYRAVVAASKALLVDEGITSSVDSEILLEAQNRLVKRGVLPANYARLSEEMQDMGTKLPSLDFTRSRIEYAQSYVQTCHIAFEEKERDLKKKEKEAKTSASPSKEEESSPTPHLELSQIHARMDLSGVACPINYVKAKLKLEELDPGQFLELILDDGEPIRNVPESLKNDGQKVHLKEKVDEEHYRLVVEKV